MGIDIKMSNVWRKSQNWDDYVEIVVLGKNSRYFGVWLKNRIQGGNLKNRSFSRIRLMYKKDPELGIFRENAQ